MSQRRAGRIAALISVVWAVASLGGCGGSPSAVEGCRDATLPAAKALGVEVHLESELTADGQIRVRLSSKCPSSDRAATVRDALNAIDRIPVGLRPARVTLHVDPQLPAHAPPLSRVEFHRPSHALLVVSRDRWAMTPTVWLHELAHVQMDGPRPRGFVAQRLLAVLEEGIADLYAAQISGQSVIGSERGAVGRDLGAPPSLPAPRWEPLFVDRQRFDPHLLGWALAARLWARADRAVLLPALLSCMANPSPVPERADTPREALRAWLHRCPSGSLPAIREVVDGWFPAELLPPPQPQP